jgi:oligopeptide/dipeptide ABC transporter ATP-binding protein
LLKDLQQERGMALILISHDLGAIANMARDTLVMYRGTVVEAAATQQLFAAPGHPYTQGLLGSIPDPDHKVDELATIPGRVPMMGEHVSGCQFHPRCLYATDVCRHKAVPKLGTDHLVYCHHPLIDVTQQGAL